MVTANYSLRLLRRASETPRSGPAHAGFAAKDFTRARRRKFLLTQVREHFADATFRIGRHCYDTSSISNTRSCTDTALLARHHVTLPGTDSGSRSHPP